ncbi:MAG: septal ring lytic transglycosylase RlpA family protein [Hyphomicrobiales bacterium]
MALTGCSGKKSAFSGKGSPVYKGPDPIPKGGGHYKVGKTYRIAGRTYYPKEDPHYDKTGTASWYGPKFHKRATSNGEWFDMNALTAAHPTLPMPTYAKVTNLENRRTLVVRINDRGPYVSDRIIDLSKKSADVLGIRKKGTARVRVQYIGKAPVNDTGADLIAMNRKYGTSAAGRTMVASRTARPRRVKASRHDTAPARQTAPTVTAQPVQPTYAPDQTQTALAAAGGTTHMIVSPTNEVTTGSVPAVSDAAMFYVQAAAFSNQHNAHRLSDRLREIGNVQVDAKQIGQNVYYLVRVGPLTDEGSADHTLRRVVAAGHRDARIVVH